MYLFMKQFVLIFASLVVMLPIFSAMASATELNYYGIEASIDKSFLVTTTSTLIFDRPINHLDYNLDFNILNLSVTSLSGTNRCDFNNIDSGSKISCNFYGMTENDTTIKFTFTTRSAITRIGDDYEFKASFPIAMPTKRMFSIIKLPPQGMLAADVANQSYLPPDGKVLTDGKKIIVSWQKTNLTMNDLLTFSVLYEVTGAGDVMWDVTIMALTFIVVFSMFGVAIYMRRGSKTAVKEVKVLPLLNKDEKKIVDIIAKHEGESRQRALVKESDFSKAKVSRLVKNLTERGVVETEPISGRENKVILKIKGVGE